MSKKTNKTSYVMNLIANGTNGTEGQGLPAEAAEASAAAKDAGTAEDAPDAGAEVSAANVRTVTDAQPAAGAQTTATLQAASNLQTAENARASSNPQAAANVQTASDRQNEGTVGAMTKDRIIVINERSETEKLSAEIKNTLEENIVQDIGDKYMEEAERREKEYHMVNVMEQLIGDYDIEKHMQQYGVCMCSRCREDVRALMLTRLPAKYVVVDQTATAPIIGYYEGKYRTRILSEIMRACITVKENQRH